MTTRFVFAALVSALLVFSGFAQAQSKINPNPGQDLSVPPPNLSFPLIITDYIEMLYETAIDPVTGLPVVDDPATPENESLVPIILEESLVDSYAEPYDNDEYRYWWDENCVLQPVDDPETALNESLYPMETWLEENKPWFAHPTAYIDSVAQIVDGNVWQAEWVKSDIDTHYVDFIDWGNPLENNTPVVGQRFPVEVALHERLDVPMIAYNMACLAYPGSRNEIFGTSKLGEEAYTYESYFATLITPKFSAEVWNPDGTITTMTIEPGKGPSGKVNYASAGGGWTPTMAGTHRIWLHISDPRVVLLGAVVNDDDHVNMKTGSICETLSPNKLEKSGIVGNSTYIDVLVVKPSGKK